MTRRSPMPTAERAKLGAVLQRRYYAGESVRALAADTGHPYGVVHGLLAARKTLFRSGGLASTQASRAVLTALLAGGEPTHGYALAKLTDVDGRVVYPILDRLERDGVLASAPGPGEEGRPPRRLYRFADGGRERAERALTGAVPAEEQVVRLRALLGRACDALDDHCSADGGRSEFAATLRKEGGL